MDIKKLNEFLSPYKIEIVCDNCQKKSDQSLKSQGPKTLKEEMSTVPQTDRKSGSKINKGIKNIPVNKKIKSTQEIHKLAEIPQKVRKSETQIQHNVFTTAQKSSGFICPNWEFNPPNRILNLNYHPTEVGRKLNIQELLESHRNTPNKIEDIDFEKYYYSEKKENNFKNNFTNSTAQPLLFCPEESPISYKEKKKGFGQDNGSYERYPLVGMPSRDASPFQTPYRRNPETPSYRDRTPKNPIQFTPNIRGLDNFEDMPHEQFNLLENPFEEKL